MNYSAEFKESIIRRMLPPNNEAISKIASSTRCLTQETTNKENKHQKNIH